MLFLSREDAGRKLGQRLLEEEVPADLVLGLPRGGVMVGAEVARILRLPLEVIVVRKIGHPRHREFAVGALAEGDVVVLDKNAIEKTGVTPDELEDVIAEERARLLDYQAKFERNAPLPSEGKHVILVDDGLATGATAEAAVLSVQKHAAKHVIVAVPVASENACERLRKTGAEVVTLLADPWFEAVGRYYEQFSQTTDDEVIEALQENRHNRDHY